MNTLFVCRSNACRSIMAEALYNNLTATKDASSAGIQNDFKEVHPYTVDVMTEIGISVEGMKPRLISEEITRAAGRIILMIDESLPDYLIRNDSFSFWNVPDPRYGGLDEVRDARNTIEHLIVKNLLG